MMNDDEITGHGACPETGLPPFDDPKYLALLDEDVSAEEASEFLQHLNAILMTCVDIGFGVDTVSLAIPGLAQFCESSQEDADFSGPDESGAVQIESKTRNFNSAAMDEPQKEDQ